MKRQAIISIFLIITSTGCCFSQSTISGKVITDKGAPLPGSNIYILNTFDGTSADADGNFKLVTQQTGQQVITVSSIGFEPYQQPVMLENGNYTFTFTMKETASELTEVVITAGTMEATNDRKVTMLRPLDIVTTAGAAGDIIGAIQTLPGTSRVGEQTGLFVRGGDASEAIVIIDGMIVQNFFTSDVPGIAQRSRFSPFQFKGTSFSSGGYSVRYGQALSSVLELSTNDMPSRSTLNAGINMSGVFASGAKVYNNHSLEITSNYINVSPFYNIANTNFDFYEAPNGGAGSLRWVAKHKDKGILKVLASHGGFSSGTEVPNINKPDERFRFGLSNANTYTNTSYIHTINSSTYSFTAFSFGKNTDDVSFGDVPSQLREWRAQARTEVGHELNKKTTLLSGVEWQRYSVQQKFDTLSSGFYETQAAAYSELEWKVREKFALKGGIRGEHSKILDQFAVAPRLSMGLKTGNYSQVSLAGGLFYQNPGNRYLLADKRAGFQRAVHLITNYQWVTDKQTFRVEGYYKSYEQLVRELNTPFNGNPYRFVTASVDNSGHGYAQGIDVFWRDRKSISNFDYWLSYSFVDTKRLFESFPAEATPTFITQHNLNLIAKYFIEAWNVSLAGTYSFSSGRPYFNPNNNEFLSDRAPHYENLSVSFSYLTHIKKAFTVIYAGIDNVMNRKNIFGYRYSTDGTQRYPVEPALYRSIFVGMNISMTAFNRDEL
jgi:hypothetical protein